MTEAEQAQWDRKLRTLVSFARERNSEMTEEQLLQALLILEARDRVKEDYSGRDIPWKQVEEFIRENLHKAWLASEPGEVKHN